MKLAVPTLDDLEQVRVWRNNEPQFLRTPYQLTEEMQEDFYETVVNNRDSNHRYWSLIGDDIHERERLFGLGGLTNIEWENGTAELSLIIHPAIRGQGFGRVAISMILKKAFLEMRLHSVYGEVYDCGNRGFIEKIVTENGGYMTKLKARKFWNGVYYDSLWYCFIFGGIIESTVSHE